MKSHLLTCVALALIPATSAMAQSYQPPVTEWGVPDLQGVWKHATVMPFERLQSQGTKQAYTEAEAVALESAQQQRFEEDNEPLDPNRPPPEVAESLPPIGNYDLFWRDDAQFIPTIGGEFRTSAIIRPSNGRMPERVAGFSDRMAELRARPRPERSDGPEGRGLGERCLVGFGNTSGPVMQPVIYNSHMQIVQSPDHVAINVEMAHDTRIIRIADERNPAAEVQRKWMGDSIGYYEGDTLVVETKYFNGWHRLRGIPVENMTVRETFRRESEFKIIYGFEVEDPSVFSESFYGEYPLSRIEEPLYEYACHEGNYGMVGILAGARRLEQLEVE